MNPYVCMKEKNVLPDAPKKGGLYERAKMLRREGGRHLEKVLLKWCLQM